MKKLLFISVLSVLATACGNSAQTEAAEEKQRDSMDNAPTSIDEQMVEAMEAKDDSANRAAAMHNDSMGHEGHDHSGHSH